MNYYEKIGEIINPAIPDSTMNSSLKNFLSKYKDVREKAMENLKVLEKRNALPMGRPSAIAGALLYYSKGSSKLIYTEIVSFLMMQNFTMTEATLRKYYREFCSILGEESV